MNRDPYLDNLKGVLIFLVVLGHLIEPIRSFDLSAAVLYKFIYIFHMPLFVIIAGYLSKRENKIREIHYLVTYLFFQLLICFLFDRNIQILKPETALWFLLALFFWNIMIKYFKDFKYPLLISICIALLAGFWNEFGALLAIRRTLMFFPFFVLGYRLEEGSYRKYLNFLTKKQAIFGISGTLFLIYILYVFHDIPYKNLWYAGDKSYEFLIQNVSVLLGPLFQLLVYISSLLLSLFIAKIVPRKGIPILTKLGTNSIVIYTLHIIVWEYLERYDFYNLKPNTGFLLIISILITVILGSRFLVKIYHALISSKFLRKIFIAV